MVETSASVVMSLDESIAYHLEYNAPLPLPEVYAKAVTPACIEAIKAVNDHNLDTLIRLPKGMKCVWENEKSDFIPAYALVYIYNLVAWLNPEWDTIIK